MPKVWKAPLTPPEELVFDLLDVPYFVVQTLYNRGLTSAAQIRAFLDKDDGTSGDPFQLADMDTAVGRIRRGIAAGERMAVYADFDVDGVCSAVILTGVLRTLGAAVDVYIPRRREEGYGLNVAAIDKLADDGISLVITADCGTSSSAEISHARQRGVDVIVTDHHHVHTSLPPALAVINPHRPDCRYPFKELAGVGVAYKLGQALATSQADSYSDLVALGTVVDVAPLLGENRSLVRRGLAAMRRSPRVGLKALSATARVAVDELDAGKLGFIIGPRLNAAGRLDSAMTSYKLLTADDEPSAIALAQELEQHNAERKRLLEEAMTTARAAAAAQAEANDNRLIFVAGEQYFSGIVGLVAGRLAEEFYRPAVAVEIGESLCKGSCRSVEGFHMARALDECSDLLVRHGGHAQAAGFTVRRENLDTLHDRLAAIAQRELGAQALQPAIAIDSMMALSDNLWTSVQWLERMEPFGVGNPAPLFRSDGVQVTNIRLMGNGHVGFSLRDGTVSWSAVAFRQAQAAADLRSGDCIDVVYSLEQRSFAGEQHVQLIVRDFRRSV